MNVAPLPVLPNTFAQGELLFESMPVGIVFQDAAGRITAANPAAERLLGLSRDQMRGVSSADPRWHAIREDGSPFPGREHPSMSTLRTGVAQRDVVMGVFNPTAGSSRSTAGPARRAATRAKRCCR